MASFCMLRCDCYVRTIFWRGSNIRLPYTPETLEHIGYVIFYAVPNLNCIFNRILVFYIETNEIRRIIILISCICINRMQNEHLSTRRKYYIHCMSVGCHFLKDNYSVAKSFSRKSLSSVNVHSPNCNFTACNFTKSPLRNIRFLVALLNFQRNCFSEIIWIVTFELL